MPLVVKSLTALQLLNLSGNQCFDVDEADTDVLLELRQLRSLDLAKPERVHGTKLVYTADGVQAAFDYLQTCLDGGRPLRVNFDPELSETYKAETAYFGAFL